MNTSSRSELYIMHMHSVQLIQPNYHPATTLAAAVHVDRRIKGTNKDGFKFTRARGVVPHSSFFRREVWEI